MKRMTSWSWVLGLAAAAALAACGGGGGGSPYGDRTPVDFTSVYPEGSPVAVHGSLSVDGNQLEDEHGDPVQLRGVGSYGLQWKPQFMNATALTYMRQAWGVSVTRAAMYVDEGGFKAMPKAMVERVEDTIAAAAAAGVYVLIDWHILTPGDPQVHADDAEEFFDYMSAKYGANPHVIFEIANEPNRVTWTETVKPYSLRIIPAIRRNAPDSIIVVGTPNWSQLLSGSGNEAAALDPIEDPVTSYTLDGTEHTATNLMYTAHFYAGTHGQWLRDRITAARAANLAVFVTEWGTTNATGGGSIYESETRTWIDFLNAAGVSWCNWHLSDQNEGSALLVPGASRTGPWDADDLTPSGELVVELLQAAMN
ncbi:MAG TPA: glycoside hydrolase family 5 protein [Anaeromyxobacter sp.]|nr:glycoside hydrolase family 5 protein [Anaeromyxobacter sp.]